MATPTFSGLSAPTITYGTATTTLSGQITAGTAIPSGSVAITLNGVTTDAAINADDRRFLLALLDRGAGRRRLALHDLVQLRGAHELRA